MKGRMAKMRIGVQLKCEAKNQKTGRKKKKHGKQRAEREQEQVKTDIYVFEQIIHTIVGNHKSLATLQQHPKIHKPKCVLRPALSLRCF